MKTTNVKSTSNRTTADATQKVRSNLIRKWAIGSDNAGSCV